MSDAITDWVRIPRLSLKVNWIVIGQVLAVVVTILGVRFLTELLEPIALGELLLAVTMLSLASLILIGPLSSGAANYFSIAEKGVIYLIIFPKHVYSYMEIVSFIRVNKFQKKLYFL